MRNPFYIDLSLHNKLKMVGRSGTTFRRQLPDLPDGCCLVANIYNIKVCLLKTEIYKFELLDGYAEIYKDKMIKVEI